jgi:hypothetical protein
MLRQLRNLGWRVELARSVWGKALKTVLAAAAARPAVAGEELTRGRGAPLTF